MRETVLSHLSPSGHVSWNSYLFVYSLIMITRFILDVKSRTINLETKAFIHIVILLLIKSLTHKIQ